METTDIELIYLIRTESLQSAFNILFSRYFDNLVKAAINYYFDIISLKFKKVKY